MYPPHGAGPLTMRLRASPSTSDHTTAIPEDPEILPSTRLQIPPLVPEKHLDCGRLPSPMA